jgi:probable rRNA maturation factor
MQAESGTGDLAIHVEIDSGGWPDEEKLTSMARQVVAATWAVLDLSKDGESEVSLLFTDDARMRELNAQWRGMDKPTNVLSFPAVEYRGGPLPPMLGDIVLAAETVAREAELENRPLAHHICHLMVHGLLHLLGHDHQTDEEAEQMEGLETVILRVLGIPDPYSGSVTD